MSRGRMDEQREGWMSRGLDRGWRLPGPGSASSCSSLEQAESLEVKRLFSFIFLPFLTCADDVSMQPEADAHAELLASG